MPITATADPSNEPPRVALSGTTTGATVSVSRTNADGSVHPVRAAGLVALSGGAWTGVWDYEAPFGQAVTYEAVSNTGVVSTSTAVTLDTDRAWLVYPGVPSASQRIRIQTVAEVNRSVDRGVFRPAGRRDAVVVSDRRKSLESALTLYTATLAERDDILALVELGAVLLLNVPPSLGYDLSWGYISIGDVSETRPIRMLNDAARFIALPYVVTSRPVGLEAALWTWADVLLEEPTWLDLKNGFSSWTATVTHLTYS